MATISPGSTDALEFLSRAGIKTVLFMEPPTAAQLDNYEGLQAIGVAGLTRSMKPADMEATLRPAFTALKQLGAPHVHYKVCSHVRFFARYWQYWPRYGYWGRGV
jgi:uncharacterized protein YgbK (DUF1537 family)